MPEQQCCHLCQQILEQIIGLRDDVKRMQSLLQVDIPANKTVAPMKIYRVESHLTKIERLGIGSQVVELFNRGFTLREIAETISMNSGVQVSHAAVYRFLRRVKKYTN